MDREGQPAGVPGFADVVGQSWRDAESEEQLMHRSVLVVTKHGLVEEVEGAITPYLDKEFDLYQVGGRWCGLLDGYRPNEDPANIVSCELCQGTGTRNDQVGLQLRAKDLMFKCNGCQGAGKHPVWPSMRKMHTGDTLPVAEVLKKDKLSCAAVVVDGIWINGEVPEVFEIPAWWFRKMFESHKDEYVTVVDVHY